MNVIIHVGYHKTATTWLQKHVFSSHPEILYLDPLKPELSWIAEIGMAHDFDFNASYYQGLLNNTLMGTKRAAVLTSWEGFVGLPLIGAQYSKRNALRIASVFPQPRIVIGIRNQLSMVVSLYKQYVHEGGTCNFRQFINLAIQGRMGHFSLDYLRFDRLISTYIELFGSASIFVYLYEELCASPTIFLNDLYSFLGVEISDNSRMNVRENRGMSYFSLGLMRLANSFLSTARNPCAIIPSRLLTGRQLRNFLQKRIDPLLSDRFFASHTTIDLPTKEHIESYCKNGNRMLQDQLGLPLAKYDYPLR